MNKLNLKNVTAVIIDGFYPADKNAKVLNYCSNLCDFHSLKLFSFEKPKIEYNFDFFEIDRLNYLEYSLFAIKELPKYIESEFALVLNHDGYIVNVNAWDNNFLKYDYIGAPWLENTLPNARVGNGGFSLRSKKLLDRCMKEDFIIKPLNDDVMICSVYKDLLENDGLRFAPVELAARFSWGGSIPEFHRNWNEAFGAHMTRPNAQVSHEMLKDFINLINNEI